jgi:hypothetical protein
MIGTSVRKRSLHDVSCLARDQTLSFMPHSFPSEFHYIRLAVSPPNPDHLSLRKTLQDSLTQTFGVTASSTYIDILWVSAEGEQFVARVGNRLVIRYRSVGQMLIQDNYR